MKDRLLNGWNVQRVLFVIMGTVVIIQGVVERQWMPVMLGVYFASMGLFSFGCASGACFQINSRNEPLSDEKPDVKSIDYEEVKGK
jgi:hypothetical protein